MKILFKVLLCRYSPRTYILQYLPSNKDANNLLDMSLQEAQKLIVPLQGSRLNAANDEFRAFVRSKPGRTLFDLPGQNVDIHPQIVTA